MDCLATAPRSIPSRHDEFSLTYSPPTAEALLFGMLQLQRKMRRNRAGVRWYRS